MIRLVHVTKENSISHNLANAVSFLLGFHKWV